MSFIVLFCIFGIIMEVYHFFFHEKMHDLQYKGRKITGLTTFVRDAKMYLGGLELAVDDCSESDNMHLAYVASTIRENVRILMIQASMLDRQVEEIVQEDGGCTKNLKQYLWRRTFTRLESIQVIISTIVEIGYFATIIGLVRQIAIVGETKIAWCVGLMIFGLSIISAINDYGEEPMSRRWYVTDVVITILTYIFVLWYFFPMYS